MDFKVGDVVTVRSDLIPNEYYGLQVFVTDMLEFRGKKVTIEKVFGDGQYIIKQDSWRYTNEMFEEFHANQKSPTLDFLVRKISEIIDNSRLKVEFYGDEIAFDLFENPLTIEFIAKTNQVYFDCELSDGKIDPETFMMIAKVMELLEQNKPLLKEFCQ